MVNAYQAIGLEVADLDPISKILPFIFVL